MKQKTAPPEAQDVRRLFHDVARTAGYLFGIVGGFFFFLGIGFLTGESSKAQTSAWLLQLSGSLFTISWLLLRFAAGLFPFGWRLFR